MTASFRYKSSWEQFENSVKILKSLISQNQAYWMIGCIKNLDIYIDETVEETLQEDVLTIIQEEVLYLLLGLLEGEKIEESDIRDAVVDIDQDISKEKLQEIVTSILNKNELVKDAFDIGKLAVRYNLKKETVNAKLSEFGYDIYTTKLLEGEKAECAIISLSSKKKLRNMKEPSINFLRNEEIKGEVSFLCDKDDLDLLIHHLETIRRKMDEY